MECETLNKHDMTVAAEPPEIASATLSPLPQVRPSQQLEEVFRQKDTLVRRLDWNARLNTIVIVITALRFAANRVCMPTGRSWTR